VAALLGWLRRLGWLGRILGERRRGVVVRKEGYIRPNIIHGGGFYRLRVLSGTEEWDLLVDAYELYRQVPEGVLLEFRVHRDPRGLWLRSFRRLGGGPAG